jgi:4-hydroxyacetophenone monooxygenase
VWSDPRARNYYWTKHGRWATQNPLDGPDIWRSLKAPDFADMEIR